MAASKGAKPNGTPRNETLMALRNELEAFGEALNRTRDRAVDLENRPGCANKKTSIVRSSKSRDRWTRLAKLSTAH